MYRSSYEGEPKQHFTCRQVAMKTMPHQVWKTMNKKDMRQFATAVFFLFATIGPLTMLMESAIIQGSWIHLAIMTLLSGSFSASIILFMGRPMRLIASILIYITVILTLAFTKPEFMEPDVPTIDAKSDIPFSLTKEQLKDIENKRTMFGLVSVVCISLGYGLFVRSLGKENKRRADIEAEVKLAQAIHESLLPRSPLVTSWCEIAGMSIPATQIGGDFFDIITISKTKILVVIADASGHGTGAGILSAMTKSGIIQELRHTQSPAELLKNVNATIHGVTKKNMFVTCAAALFDRETMMVSMVTAGHPPILRYVLVTNTVEEFRMHNLGLGISPTAEFESRTIPFHSNDIFCFITDGLPEASNAKNEQFGMDRVTKHIQNAPQHSAVRLNNEMFESVKQFSAGKDLEDDITCVITRIT